MFFLNFPDKVAEKCLHFFDKFVKLNCASVGILVDDVIQFFPWHFLASFVEKSALISIGNALFTNKAWFFAVWVDTKNGTFVAINTFRVFLNLARHCGSLKKMFG